MAGAYFRLAEIRPECRRSFRRNSHDLSTRRRRCTREVPHGGEGQLEAECRYRTRKTWSWKRRIIYKAEVGAEGKEPKDNPRFVVPNMKQSPQWIYEEVYCPRGDLENRIKELHHGMEIGRTSGTNFWANQFRVLMAAAAYVWMQELRLGLAGTGSARGQVSILRQRFLKLGAPVVVSVRRIVLHFPQSVPYFDSFHRLALSLGAQSG